MKNRNCPLISSSQKLARISLPSDGFDLILHFGHVHNSAQYIMEVVAEYTFVIFAFPPHSCVFLVIPAKAGIYEIWLKWIPACAGMTRVLGMTKCSATPSKAGIQSCNDSHTAPCNCMQQYP